MNVFKGRPGLIAGFFSVCCITVSAFLIEALTVSLIITALFGAVFCLVLLLCRVIRPYRCFSVLFVIIIAVATLLRGHAFFVGSSAKADALCSESARVHATVTERLSSSDYYTIYTVRVHSVDGERADLLASLECAYNSDLQTGYEFVMRNAVISSAWDADSDSRNSLIASNTLLVIESESYEDCVILSEGNLSLKARISRLNSYLGSRLTNGIGGVEGRLCAAMLLGDRDHLNAEHERDFSRAGLSHYLAVSGMHVALLTSIVGIVLSRFRIKRSLKNLIMAAFSLIYLTLLGFPVSATRAVVMLLIVYIAYFTGDSADSLNSLGIAAAFILIIAPYAIFDGSFILSFCATLGIVTFLPTGEKLLSDLLNHRKNVSEHQGERNALKHSVSTLIKKLIVLVYRTLFTVLSALSFTLLPTALIFGRVSSVGILSNIPAVIIATPLLALSGGYLVFGRIHFVGKLIKAAIILLADSFIALAEYFSGLDGAVIALSAPIARVVAFIFTAVILLIASINLKNKKLCSIAPSLYAVAIIAVSLITPLTYGQSPSVTFVSTGKDESALVSCENKVALIDVSDGAYSKLKSLLDIASKTSATEIDTLILTHYHNKHIYSVTRLMSEEVLRCLFLPEPVNEDDLSVLYAILSSAESHGCSVYLVGEGTPIPLPGGVTLELSSLDRLERSAHPTFWLKLRSKDTTLVFLSESAWESPNHARSIHDAAMECDLLLLSAHGPISKTEVSINAPKAREIAVFDPEILRFVSFDGCSDSTDIVLGAELRDYVFCVEGE